MFVREVERKMLQKINKSLILIILIVLGSSLAFAANPSFTITAPSTLSPGATGESVTVSLDTGGNQIAGVGFTLQSSSTKLTFSTDVAAKGTLNIGSTFVNDCKGSGDKWVCSISGTNGANGAGSLASQKFGLATDAPSSITLSLTGISLLDDLGDSVSYDTPSAATITVLAECTDNDSDGYGVNCAKGSDCDDTNAAVGAKLSYYPDEDKDGYGNSKSKWEKLCPAQAKSGGKTRVSNNGDCNDKNNMVNPGAKEVSNGVDDDCDGVTDELQQPGADCTTDNQCLSEESCVNQKCSTILNEIKDVLNDNTKTTLQKLSAIASALAKHFSS